MKGRKSDERVLEESFGYVYFDGTKISSFTPYTVDSITNSNASNFSQA